MSQESPPPGWYRHTAAGDRMRWWDGERWTDHYTDRPGDTRQQGFEEIKQELIGAGFDEAEAEEVAQRQVNVYRPAARSRRPIEDLRMPEWMIWAIAGVIIAVLAVVIGPIVLLVVLVLVLVRWLVSRTQTRACPRCGGRVQVGTLRCPSCGFDFRSIG